MKPSENKTFFLEYEHDYCSTEYKLYLDSFSPQRIKSEEIQRRLNVRGLKLIINLGWSSSKILVLQNKKYPQLTALLYTDTCIYNVHSHSLYASCILIQEIKLRIFFYTQHTYPYFKT